MGVQNAQCDDGRELFFVGHLLKAELLYNLYLKSVSAWEHYPTFKYHFLDFLPYIVCLELLSIGKNIHISIELRGKTKTYWLIGSEILLMPWLVYWKTDWQTDIVTKRHNELWKIKKFHIFDTAKTLYMKDTLF